MSEAHPIKKMSEAHPIKIYFLDNFDSFSYNLVDELTMLGAELVYIIECCAKPFEPFDRRTMFHDIVNQF